MASLKCFRLVAAVLVTASMVKAERGRAYHYGQPGSTELQTPQFRSANPRFRGLTSSNGEGSTRLDCPRSCLFPPPPCPPKCPPPPPPCPPTCPPPCPPDSPCPPCMPGCEPCCRPPPVCFPGCEPCCWPPPPCPPGCPRRPLPKVKPFMPKPNENPKPCVPKEFPAPGLLPFGLRAENFRSGASVIGKMITTVKAGLGAPETPDCHSSNYNDDPQDDVPVFPILPPQRVSQRRIRRSVDTQQNYFIPLESNPMAGNTIDLDISNLDPRTQQRIGEEMNLADKQATYDPEVQLLGGNGDAPPPPRHRYTANLQNVQPVNFSPQMGQVDPRELLEFPFPAENNPYRSGANIFNHAFGAAKVARKRVDRTLYPYRANEDKCKGLKGEQRENCLKYASK